MTLMSWESIVIIVAIGAGWAALVFSSRCRVRRRRQRDEAWSRFEQGHRELDTELDEVWHRR